MADREPVELTDSAKRKLKKLREAESTGSGAAANTGKAVIRSQTSAAAAQNAARAALGIRRKNNQSTDSNN